MKMDEKEKSIPIASVKVFHGMGASEGLSKLINEMPPKKLMSLGVLFADEKTVRGTCDRWKGVS